MKYKIVIFLLVWSVGALAEQLPQQDSLQSPTRYTFYNALYRLYEQSPGQVLFHPTTKYGLSSAKAALTDGDWRTYQMPGSSQLYEIASRGAMQLNKVRLMGEFSYQRHLDDSVGWMLKPDHQDKSPYYLANQKPGNWDAHTYLLKGAGSLPLAGPLNIILGAELNLGSYGRFTDPRPEVSRYRLKLNGGIGYKKNNFGVVLSGIYGYGDEKTAVSYANAMNNTPGRPAYVTNDIMGYGYYRTVGSGSPKLQEDQLVKGLAAILQASTLNVAYTYTQTERKYVREVDINRNAAIGDVYHHQHHLLASYTCATTRAQNLISLDLMHNQLTDYNHAIIDGNNYSGTLLSVSPSYQAKRNKWEYGGSLYFNHERRKDGTAAISYFIQTAALELVGSRLFELQKGFLKLDSHVGYRTDMGSDLQIGSQYNEFMKGVILPDYIYYSADQLSSGVTLGYGLNVREVIFMPVLSYSLQRPLNTGNNSAAKFTPNGIRNAYSFSLQIHL